LTQHKLEVAPAARGRGSGAYGTVRPCA
jgi:hypothetical protein